MIRGMIYMGSFMYLVVASHITVDSTSGYHWVAVIFLLMCILIELCMISNQMGKEEK